MSTFFENQLQAKKKTTQLLFLYAASVLCIIIGIYFLIIFSFGIGSVNEVARQVSQSTASSYWHPNLLFSVSIIVILLIFFASLIKIMQLGSSGSKVAIMLGGRLVQPSTTDPVERKLLNIVEEMAIAAGMKVPPVYLLEHEKGINAFAAGTSPGTAAIGVSRGCMELLTRDELQGVIAHEFSHILNGDMSMNIRLIGILHGILFIALTGRLIMRATYHSGRRSRDNKGGGIALLGLGLLIIGYAGVFFATLIKMAVSRQREFLADASAVQFTRLPEGISGALKKIGSLNYGSKINHHKAEEASHMYFADGIRSKFSGLMSTHPPLDVRVKKIDKSFNGVFPSISYEEILAKVSPERIEKPEEAKQKSATEALDPLLEPILNNPAGKILNSVGTLGAANIVAAQALLSSFPKKVLDAAHEPFTASLMIFLVLIDENPEIREKQLELLKVKLQPSTYQEFLKLYERSGKIADEKFLAMLDLCLPALDQLSEKQYMALRQVAYELAHIDDRIDLLEYTLQVTLLRHFDKKFYPEKFKLKAKKSLAKLVKPASDLLLGLAVLGNPDDIETAKISYLAGIEHCAISEEHQADFSNLPHIDLDFLDLAIKEFANVDYKIREIILRAAISTISQDKEINLHELALIRALADSFDCPVPLLSTQS